MNIDLKNIKLDMKSLKFMFKRAFRTRFIILYYFISLLRGHTGSWSFTCAHTLKEIIAPNKCLKTITEYLQCERFSLYVTNYF